MFVVEHFFVVIDHANRRGEGVGATEQAQVHAVAHIAVAGDGIRARGVHRFAVGFNGYVLQGLRLRCAGFGLRGGFRLHGAVVAVVGDGELGETQAEQGECDFV